MATALLITPENSNTITEIDVNGLADLQELVGGWVEMVTLNSEKWGNNAMYINEEGKMRGMDVNLAATHLSEIWPHDVIVGPAVIIGHTNDGELSDVTSEAIDIINRT